MNAPSSQIFWHLHAARNDRPQPTTLQELCRMTPMPSGQWAQNTVRRHSGRELRSQYARSIMGGAIPAANSLSEQYRKPEPRGPSRYFRPVADSRSHPIARTSIGSCPTVWQASRRYVIPCRFATSPADRAAPCAAARIKRTVPAVSQLVVSAGASVSRRTLLVGSYQSLPPG